MATHCREAFRMLGMIHEIGITAQGCAIDMRSRLSSIYPRRVCLESNAETMLVGLEHFYGLR